MIKTLSKEAREFCGLESVPANYYFSRFKKDFVSELENLFNHLVDVTEPICQQINPDRASTIAFDTSGIEAYVTENNPKFINPIIRKLKQCYKKNPNVDVYKMAYGLMPSSASANNEIKQLFINGYFCYVYKFAIIPNGLGIVRNISFLDNDFKQKHTEIVLVVLSFFAFLFSFQSTFTQLVISCSDYLFTFCKCLIFILHYKPKYNLPQKNNK